MHLSRRLLLQRGAAFSVGFAGLRTLLGSGPAFAANVDPKAPPTDGYGPLVADPGKIFDLPKGFSYTVISRRGDTMSDGLVVPGQPDGMAAFIGPAGTTLLVRNHELGPSHPKYGPWGKTCELLSKTGKSSIYDYGKGRAPALGGTTTVVYNTKEQKVEKQFLSLAGTFLNCAGGPTPWGSWLTCEECHISPDGDVEKDHGYVFEVPATSAMELAPPIPLKAMGRFYHEAVAVDPRTGIVYLTEDRADGLMYRFIPTRRGVLREGGVLQVLVIRDRPSLITQNREGSPTIPVGTKFPVAWMTMAEFDTPKNDMRHRGFAAGAARFTRGEGMWWGHNCAFFAATEGGANQRGQIWRYTPSPDEGDFAKEDSNPGVVELYLEPDDASAVENADNITVAPWGDLFICEDEAVKGDDVNRLMGVTPAGKFYAFGKNVMSPTELAGVCFSPDGSTMFVNLQGNGLTLAVTGPWKKG